MRSRVFLPLAVLTIGGIVLGALASPPARTVAAKPAEAAAHWKAMFPQGLIDANGAPVDAARLNGKIVGLYFSALTCVKCRVVTPILAKIREQNAANFEVVFISCDQSKEEQRKYMAKAGMKWPSVEWGSAPAEAILDKFDFKFTPALVVLAPDGKIITRAGCPDVLNDANSPAVAKWQKAAK